MRKRSGTDSQAKGCLIKCLTLYVAAGIGSLASPVMGDDRASWLVLVIFFAGLGIAKWVETGKLERSSHIS